MNSDITKLTVPILSISNTTDDISNQVLRAILHERERRGYAVVVSNVRKAFGVAGVAIPRGLDAYVAETRCTVQHEGGIPCLWTDFVFYCSQGGELRVLLQNDLLRPGMVLEESVRKILAEMEVEINSKLSRKNTEVREMTIHLAHEKPGMVCAVYSGTYSLSRRAFELFVAELGPRMERANQAELKITLRNGSHIHFFWLTNPDRSRGMRFDVIDGHALKGDPDEQKCGPNSQ